MEKEQPIVSLLVPIYGVEPYIEQCARALFGQTYPHIEYIFVNDCSPDRSIALLEKVLMEFPQRAPQVRIVNHEHNRGLAAARNTAIEHAAGEWVLMHDSDDWLEPDAVEQLVGAIDDRVDMVTCNFYHGPAPCNDVVFKQQRYPTNGVEWLKASLGKDSDVSWMVWCKLLRRSLFDNPGVRWTEGADMAEDLGIMVRLACHMGGVKHLEIPLVHYLTRPGSYCNGRFSRRKEMDFCKNIIDGIAYIREAGMHEEFRPVITSYLLRHQYGLLWREGFEHWECLKILPRYKNWVLRGRIGLSFRKRLVVYCGIHGWKFPALALMSISAKWRRKQRRK